MALAAATAQVLTDRVVDRIVQVLNGAGNMLSGNTEEDLYRYLYENVSDPDLLAALLDDAADVDQQILGPNWKTFLQDTLNGTEWKALHTALKAANAATYGGSYSSMGAYCNGETATIHPLYSELARLVGDSFIVSGSIVGAMHPLMSTRTFDKVWTYATDTWTNDTTDAGDADTADVAFFASDNDIIALGSRYKFDTILVELSTTAKVDTTPTDCDCTFQYWDGSTWSTLSVTDNTTGFSVNGGSITFTAPVDWAPWYKDGSAAVFGDSNEEGLYYVLITRTEDTINVNPVATWFRMVQDPVYYSGTTLYGVSGSSTLQDYQPPLAIVRITNTNTCTVTPVQSADHTRFVCPDDANNGLVMRAINAFTQDITFTLVFTDGGGTAGRSVEQSPWTQSIAAGATANISLGAYTGIRLVAATSSVVTAAKSGVFTIEATGYTRAVSVK